LTPKFLGRRVGVGIGIGIDSVQSRYGRDHQAVDPHRARAHV